MTRQRSRSGSDGRYVAMFSRHDTDSMTRWRISRAPGRVSTWSPVHVLDNRAPTTYSNVYAVSADGRDRRRWYAFTRTIGRDPHILVSDDEGATWNHGGRLLEGDGRPYVRYVPDRASRVHLITTDQHPDDFPNGIYHGVVADGRLLGSNQELIDDDVLDDRAVAPHELTPVFVSDGVQRAWTLDIGVAADGNPHIVFSVRSPDPDQPSRQRNRYQYGRFDGSRWHVHVLADAGEALYPSEPSYTGLAAVHPDDAGRVFVSTDAHPASGTALVSARDGRRHHELFEGVSSDGGATWSWTALTRDSTSDNIRPIVPRWDSPRTVVLWLRGTYRTYQDYDLEVVAAVIEPNGSARPPVACTCHGNHEQRLATSTRREGA